MRQLLLSRDIFGKKIILLTYLDLQRRTKVYRHYVRKR